jgi:Exostosin family
MLFAESSSVLQAAVDDLRAHKLPTDRLQTVLADIQRAEVSGADPSAPEPYFIPNDLSRCSPTSVLNYNPEDEELDLPAGFAIQAAASKPHSFAKPYYIDPINDARRCKGLFALANYVDRMTWTFDLSFVGWRGKRNDNAERGLLADPSNTRSIFLDLFAAEFLGRPEARIKWHLNDRFYYSDRLVSHAERQRRNEITGYIQSIADSRFVLCPRGCGPNSIRFFETLARANVPIFFGGKATKLPLDWLIDWEKACFRISCEQIVDGSWVQRVEEIVATPLDEVNRRRRYIFEVYHQFLAPERKRVFEQLVLLEARRLLIAEAAGPVVTAGVGRRQEVADRSLDDQ